MNYVLVEEAAPTTIYYFLITLIKIRFANVHGERSTPPRTVRVPSNPRYGRVPTLSVSRGSR